MGLVHRKLIERSALGGNLLTETGPMAQAQLEVTRPAGGAAIAGRAHLAAGDLDYDGRTQAGAPLTTTTRHFEGGLDLLWRPHEPAAWGEAWLTVGWLANRRLIRGTQVAGGLDELSSALLAGVRWRSPAFTPAAGWTGRVEVEARGSVAHRLQVDYYGLLLVDAGRRPQAVVDAAAAGRAGRFTLGNGSTGPLLRQPASKAVPVSRNGVPLPLTTVRQPELSTRDVALRVSRRF